ncbi:S-layer homology domain-containing protein [Paenibacillus pabuli]|uniref:S-layer homology domain-containing protein n=1 Tax=Paenibacillus pabuli TaxID=1472 RepID=UPI003242BFA1
MKKFGMAMTAALLATNIVLASFASAEADTTQTKLFNGSGFGTTSQTAASTGTKFKDIKGHWAEASINNAVKAGYVSGYADGTFKPKQEVSRAEFTKMLVMALGLETNGSGTTWYQPSVDAATRAGIYANDFKGDWNKKMPRKEMTLLAVRAGITGYKKDYDINRNLYEGAKAGLIQGTAPGVIAPDGTTTRAQAIVVIERVLSVKSGKTLASDKYATAEAEILWHKTNIYTMLPRYFSSPQYGDFDDSVMSYSIKNGKAVCSIEKFVVIDLDNPKDPNMKYIKNNDLAWLNNKYHKLKDTKNGYAVLAITDLNIKESLNNSSLDVCSISLYNKDWYETPQTSGNAITRSHGVGMWNSKFEQMYFSFDATKPGKYKWISGYVLPKGNFTSKNEFKLHFDQGGSNSDSVPLLTSVLNTKYNQ